MFPRSLLYPPPMIVRRTSFIEPCLPSKVFRPPSGPLWVHEIKHDGYRLMVRRDGLRVRCFTRNGHDWANRFPAIVDAALRLKATSFLIDGEAVIGYHPSAKCSRSAIISMIDLPLGVCRRWFPAETFAVHLSETLLIHRTASASLG